MAGGLVQLINYGIEDIFLTGEPQITFFRIVYRRHTNFSIESICQYFINVPDFCQESITVIEKRGDLVGKIYLEIDIPRINLVKNQNQWRMNLSSIREQYITIKKYYQIVSHYIAINTYIIRKIYYLLEIDNISVQSIQIFTENSELFNKLSELRNLLKNTILFDSTNEINKEDDAQSFNLLQQIPQFDIQTIIHSIFGPINQISHEQFINKIISLKKIIREKIYPSMNKFYLYFRQIYLQKQNMYQEFVNGTYQERYNFAWVEELGHAIIESVDIKLGNQIIDKHTGDWLTIYQKLFLPENKKTCYHNMIGNITELITFNSNIKECHKLIVPLQFWFCRHTGNSLPLIALKHHDLTISVKFKSLEKVCQTDYDINQLCATYQINIKSAKLYVDYIFLDTAERLRFGKSSHEYLIEIVQFKEIDDIKEKRYHAYVNFTGPTKFIIWFAQPKIYRENPTGYSKCQWNNFGIFDDKTGHPMNYTYIQINSVNYTPKDFDTKYYNYLHSLYFNNSPTDGLNIYSFATNPTEHQPSGSINLSRIENFSIVSEFTKEMMTKVSNSTIYFAIYAMSYNILRIFNGMAGLAFR